jgi:hypothetical protein
MPFEDDEPIRFTLTFRHRNESSEEDTVRAFWSQIQSNHRNSGFDDGPSKRLEERIISNFGRDLRDTLIKDFKHGSGTRNRHGRFPGDERFLEYRGPSGPVPGFSFQVNGLSYGSLTLGVDVSGIKGLAEFFDHNYDLFKTVLSQYAPLAFAVAATGYDTASIEGLSCAADVPRRMAEMLSQNGETKTSGKSTTDNAGNPSSLRTQAINWAWIVSNTSLILPVALGLAVIYMAFQALVNERDELRKAVLLLQERQNEVIRLLAPSKEGAASSTKPEQPNPTAK